VSPPTGSSEKSEKGGRHREGSYLRLDPDPPLPSSPPVTPQTCLRPSPHIRATSSHRDTPPHPHNGQPSKNRERERTTHTASEQESGPRRGYRRVTSSPYSVRWRSTLDVPRSDLDTLCVLLSPDPLPAQKYPEARTHRLEFGPGRSPSYPRQPSPSASSDRHGRDAGSLPRMLRYGCFPGRPASPPTKLGTGIRPTSDSLNRLVVSW